MAFFTKSIDTSIIYLDYIYESLYKITDEIYTIYIDNDSYLRNRERNL